MAMTAVNASIGSVAPTITQKVTLATTAADRTAECLRSLRGKGNEQTAFWTSNTSDTFNFVKSNVRHSKL